MLERIILPSAGLLMRAQLRPFAGLIINKHTYATTTKDEGEAGGEGNLLPRADPNEYGVIPDSIEHAWGLEKSMIIARLMGDDRYEPKIYYRVEGNSYDYPNLVPVHLDERLIFCECEPDANYLMQWIIRKDGKPKRCQCGHWFKAIQADPESV